MRRPGNQRAFLPLLPESINRSSRMPARGRHQRRSRVRASLRFKAISLAVKISAFSARGKKADFPGLPASRSRSLAPAGEGERARHLPRARYARRLCRRVEFAAPRAASRENHYAISARINIHSGGCARQKFSISPLGSAYQGPVSARGGGKTKSARARSQFSRQPREREGGSIPLHETAYRTHTRDFSAARGKGKSARPAALLSRAYIHINAHERRARARPRVCMVQAAHYTGLPSLSPGGV